MRLGVDASDLTTTFHRTNVPEELKGLVPDDLSSMTTRAISIGGSDTYEHRAGRKDVPAGKTWLHHNGSGCGAAARLGRGHGRLKAEPAGKPVRPDPQPP